MSHKVFNECICSSIKRLFGSANIYKGTSPNKKSDLIEMIIYGWITEKLNKKEIEDISIKQANQILNKNNIIIKSLPGYGNAALRKKKSNHMLKQNHL